MVDVAQVITKKIGPLPVWSYGAIIVVLAWAYYWYTGRTLDESDNGGTIAMPGSSDSGETPDYSADTGINTGSGNGSDGVGSGTTRPLTNDAWRTVATNYLVGLNLNPIVAGNAVTKYLTGVKLSVQEMSMVSLAVVRFGTPPEGVPESPDVPNSPPTLPDNNHPGPNTPPPAPPGYRTYVVKSGDTLWGIATKMLGNGNRWGEIDRLNGKFPRNSKGNPIIIPGRSIKVPNK